MLVLVFVEHRDRSHVQELVKEPAAVSPALSEYILDRFSEIYQRLPSGYSKQRDPFRSPSGVTHPYLQTATS